MPDPTSSPIDALSTGRLPTLVTPRLHLRWLDERDVPDLFTIYSDPQVARYTSRPPLKDHAEALAYLHEIYRFKSSRDGFQWGVTLAEGDGAEDPRLGHGLGRVLGTLWLGHIDEKQGRAEVGYVLGRAAWGNGYIHEALGALLGFAFGALGLRRLEADVDPRNERSIRVAERLGFVREGLLRERWLVGGELQDTLLFGLLAREWRGPDSAR